MLNNTESELFPTFETQKVLTFHWGILSQCFILLKVLTFLVLKHRNWILSVFQMPIYNTVSETEFANISLKLPPYLNISDGGETMVNGVPIHEKSRAQKISCYSPCKVPNKLIDNTCSFRYQQLLSELQCIRFLRIYI